MEPNILNIPALDSIAYERSSPINYTNGLKGALMICHGVIGDNVDFQDVVRLSQKLIELGKENWELAIYPVKVLVLKSRAVGRTSINVYSNSLKKI